MDCLTVTGPAEAIGEREKKVNSAGARIQLMVGTNTINGIAHEIA